MAFFDWLEENNLELVEIWFKMQKEDLMPHFTAPYPEFLKAYSSNCFEQFCSTLTLHTTSIIETSKIHPFHSELSVTGFPQIQPEKIVKQTSELNCHKVSTQYIV